ncbi:MAG: HAMP domain-containing histidine kinase [Clostridiales bacterium]|nr:HAMP domain-containing histidine kinase [Clostridiales bacterium]
MKKHFYSIWFRIVLAFFLTTLLTFSLVGAAFFLIYHYEIPMGFALKGVSVLSTFALISILCGSVISMFVIHYTMNPIKELSRAMQRVAGGDYTLTLDPACHKGEIRLLYEDFNQMVQELNSTETLHSDFISNVSHEFKTPLAAISGYATLLQDDTLTPEERSEYISTIITSARDLSRMTGNILSLSRLENQTIISEKDLFRVDEQIRQVILRMEPVWSAKDLIINPDLDSINWYGNMELTSHIWNNLLDNAVKFTPRGGEISITAHSNGEWLTVVFQDTGMGMTPEIQAHVFDKFYQGDTSHKNKGNGLGLSLVRQIVALHGGSIQLESHPDLGSTFTVLLPVQASGQMPSHPLL